MLDGPDGSGKTTQTALLAKRLRKLGKHVLLVDFPQYQTSFFGAMVGEYLKGTYGNVFQISPYLSSLECARGNYQSTEEWRRRPCKSIHVVQHHSPRGKDTESG